MHILPGMILFSAVALAISLAHASDAKETMTGHFTLITEGAAPRSFVLSGNDGSVKYRICEQKTLLLLKGYGSPVSRTTVGELTIPPFRPYLEVVLRLPPKGAPEPVLAIHADRDPLSPLAAKAEDITSFQHPGAPGDGGFRFSMRVHFARARMDRNGRPVFLQDSGKRQHAMITFAGRLPPPPLKAEGSRRKCRLR